MSKKYTILLLSLILFGCKKTNEHDNKQRSLAVDKERNCVAFIIKKDDSLGRVRNIAPIKNSLSTSIKNYVAGIQNLDFEGCPEEFEKAFMNHAKAWTAMGTFTETYPELRGELHNLFDQIERSKDSTKFKPLLDAIWNTWSDVENFISLQEP